MKINTLIKLIITILIVFSCFDLSAKPGDLDTSFGENGISLPYNSNNNYTLYCSTITPDDKIITAGIIRGIKDILVICKFDNEGYFDGDFGISGKVEYLCNTSSLSLRNLIITHENKILISGIQRHITNESIHNVILFQFINNGTIDSSFNGIGYKIYMDSSYDYYPNKIIDIPNEKCYMVLSSLRDVAVNKYYSSYMKILSNGEISTINGNDKMIIYDSTGDLYIRDFIIENEKLIMGGHLTDTITNIRKPIVIKLNKDFSNDNSFGQNGRILLSHSKNEFISILHINNDGTIIISGGYYESNKLGEFLSKLNDSGQIDSSFGLNGISRTMIQDRDYLRSLNIIPNLDNRILISGSSGFDDIDFIWMQMFNKDGIPDSSFGTDSKIMTRYSTVNTTYGLTHIQKDDKIIFIGEVGYPVNGILLYRYLTDFEVGVNDALNDVDAFIYPNPVNNLVYISYELKSPDYIKFELYNYIGDKVRDLNQPDFHESGYHDEMINLGDNLEDGSYFLKFSSSIYTKIFKIQVSK